MLLGLQGCETPILPGESSPVEAVDAENKAQTILTVVNVTQFLNESWASPSEVVSYQVTHDLLEVDYTPGRVSFDWGPSENHFSWGPGSTHLTGRIWAFRPIDEGRAYQANAWDYIDNGTRVKNRAHDVPDVWIGTMLSSLCHTNATCNAQERTNIVFWSEANSKMASDSQLVESSEFKTLSIFPHNVGVFYQNSTQQFTAIAETRSGVQVDVSDQVDWYLESIPGQGDAHSVVATIDARGLATVHSSWGRVVVKACYPKGCSLK